MLSPRAGLGWTARPLSRPATRWCRPTASRASIASSRPTCYSSAALGRTPHSSAFAPAGTIGRARWHCAMTAYNTWSALPQLHRPGGLHQAKSHGHISGARASAWCHHLTHQTRIATFNPSHWWGGGEGEEHSPLVGCFWHLKWRW